MLTCLDKKREGSSSSRRSTSGRAPSAKGSLSVKNDKKGGRSRSRISNEEPEEIEEAQPIPSPQELYDFIGYDVGDNMVHVSGSLTTLFPADGGQIRVEKDTYIHGANCVRASVLKDGNTFVLHFLEPIDEILKQEEVHVQGDKKGEKNIPLFSPLFCSSLTLL